MIDLKDLDLLQFENIRELLRQKCHSAGARELCKHLGPIDDRALNLAELHRTNELSLIIAGQGFFPPVEHEDVRDELSYLSLDGSLLHEEQLLVLLKTVLVSNSILRFVKSKKQILTYVHEMASDLEIFEHVTDAIQEIIDHEGNVKDSASSELQRIRKEIRERRKESDKKFYNYISHLKKQGFLRENEESFFNGRRTLAVLVEHKTEVPGFVHGKSESGKTIFIEPGITMSINNDIAELELDERREVTRILRELCSEIRPFVGGIKLSLEFLVYCDFLHAKALLSKSLKACFPRIREDFSFKLENARHPLLFLQNTRSGKSTVPLNISLNDNNRILVISGPNAGGKTIALKTIGILQLMLQSGLLIPVSENSECCFFEKLLVDMGDTQSIENELSTYSAKLKSMTSILEQVNEATLVLMDEFGSGTDPELGSAIAESVLESLVNSRTKGVITSHFGNVKLLADKLPGAFNASMLFDIESLTPKFILSLGEPGSSYTFEVAEKIGFPKHLIERAKTKVDQDKLRLNALLSEVQTQKTKLAGQNEQKEHETFLAKIEREKYLALYQKLEEKIKRDREKKIELVRQAEYGQKYLRLMADWKEKKSRKEVIKRFIDGLTAETKKQESLKRQNKLDAFAEKKIARIRANLEIGTKVKILNGNEIGIVEGIKDEKVFVKFGLVKMTVGMQNLVLAED
jgi:DNA mismatch repair protein MutS2